MSPKQEQTIIIVQVIKKLKDNNLKLEKSIKSGVNLDKKYEVKTGNFKNYAYKR